MYTTMQNYKCIAWQDDDTVTESSYFVQKLVLFGKLRKMSFGRLCSNTRLLLNMRQKMEFCHNVTTCASAKARVINTWKDFPPSIEHYSIITTSSHKCMYVRVTWFHRSRCTLDMWCEFDDLLRGLQKSENVFFKTLISDQFYITNWVCSIIWETQVTLTYIVPGINPNTLPIVLCLGDKLKPIVMSIWLF